MTPWLVSYIETWCDPLRVMTVIHRIVYAKHRQTCAMSEKEVLMLGLAVASTSSSHHTTSLPFNLPINVLVGTS